MQLSDVGEPIYGPRDVPELDKIRALGLPFWLAGGYGKEGKLKEALDLGAAGVQVGTPFAFCEESGIREDIKQQVIQMSRDGQARVFTDPVASPTGFPFKVAQLDTSLSNPAVYKARERICDLGYLRHLYRKTDGSVGYRCPAEPVQTYMMKGGTEAATVGRKCVCNGLPSTVGLAQIRPGEPDEAALVTVGDDVDDLARFLKPGATSFTAADVVNKILQGLPAKT
jgi:nitronate monooxygenase